MVNIETPLPAWSCHTWTRAIFTFMACLEIGRVIHNDRIVPPNPRGGGNTEKYCPRPFGPRAIFLRIPSSSWIGGYNTDPLFWALSKFHMFCTYQKSYQRTGQNLRSSVADLSSDYATRYICNTATQLHDIKANIFMCQGMCLWVSLFQYHLLIRDDCG